MKRLLTFGLIISMFLSNIKADEGMWLLPLIQKLNINKMHEMGLKLSAEDIYNINHSSLKDAVIIFGGGCTGELVSDKGLIFTNHHCGYGTIQKLSTLEHNYLEDGFWAKSMDEELPAPGLTVTFMKYMEDVTDKINAELNDDMSEDERNAKIREVSDKIIKEATDGNHYEALVKSFFAGNQFYLVVYERFKDVRFVGAPPSSIGKFGHDTDNWMWPRHTGDFSIFRVYASPDGKPAEYSPDNVPYKPKKFLPVSIKGIEKGDFAMTIGFPGSTSRYLTSYGIEERMNIINQTRIKVRGIKQEIWQKDMMADEKIKIQYASKYSRSSNYWKNSIGMNKGLEKLHVIEKKQKLEKRFQNWADSDPQLKAKYGDVLPGLKKGYEERAPYIHANYYLYESLLGGTEAFAFSLSARSLEEALKSEDQEKIDKAIEKMKSRGESFFKDYSPKTDQKVMTAMLKLYYNDIDAKYHPEIYDIIAKRFKNNFEAFSKAVFEKSIFTNEQRYNDFLADPKLKTLEKDLVFEGGKSILKEYLSLRNMQKESSVLINRDNRLFEAGLMKMAPELIRYPDANFTMRLSYGTVGDYEPRDAVIYKEYTTLKGVMEKEDPNNYEFIVPEKLKELYNKKDYGRYADKRGFMPVCFTTNNDITGGNSGSPVINANGELIGLAFDGNWEAMSGDIAFEPKLQKTICVDARYVLFIIDKYAGAKNLIDELTIVD
ncbi:MAG: S46 family peptidase [Chlorobi bacterium]|nr:S46 family peptidase [Chlorobiota bacterium]